MHGPDTTRLAIGADLSKVIGMDALNEWNYFWMT